MGVAASASAPDSCFAPSSSSTVAVSGSVPVLELLLKHFPFPWIVASLSTHSSTAEEEQLELETKLPEEPVLSYDSTLWIFGASFLSSAAAEAGPSSEAGVLCRSIPWEVIAIPGPSLCARAGGIGAGRRERRGWAWWLGWV